MHDAEGYFTNVFILQRDLFEGYCEWLFDVLFEVEKRTDLTNYSVAARRIYGYLAERLFNVYLRKIDLKSEEKLELDRIFFRNTESKTATSSPIDPTIDGATIVIASDYNFIS